MQTGQRWGSGGKRCWNEGPMLKETYCVWEESWLSVLLVLQGGNMSTLLFLNTSFVSMLV